MDINQEYLLKEDLNVTNTKPKNIIIDDISYTIDSWKDFLKTLSEHFYNLDRNIFRDFIYDKDFKGSTRELIGRNDSSMNSPLKIDNDLFIETNLNANAILNLCKLISEKYNCIDKVSFNLRS